MSIEEQRMSLQDALGVLRQITQHPSLKMSLSEHGLGQLALKALAEGLAPTPAEPTPADADTEQRAPAYDAG